MLLDSDTSLKVAHDIIHDANEFFKKWPWILKTPDHPPEGSTVTDGYVEFEFSDGSVLRIPCHWVVFQYADGSVTEKLQFRRGANSATWRAGMTGTAAGQFAGMLSGAGINIGALVISEIVAMNEGGAEAPVMIETPIIDSLVCLNLRTKGSAIGALAASDEFELEGDTFEDVETADGAVENIQFCAEEAVSRSMEGVGERKIPVDRFNAWRITAPGETPPRTNAPYTGEISFDALSPDGSPMNGFDNALISNPFYPDWIYVSEYKASWKPILAWVPSATRPASPYWQDSDGIYWYRARVVPAGGDPGSVCCCYPPRTVPGTLYIGGGNNTTPPVKADADGMIVTVDILAEGPVSICLLDKYVYQDDNTWAWAPGYTRTVTGPRICEFIVKRNFIRSGSSITAIEYQFLPLGDLNG